MTFKLLLPKIGFAMNEGKIAEWLVADGTPVKEGDLLYALESDKSVQEVPSPATGKLKIIATPGETYQVGDVSAAPE